MPKGQSSAARSAHEIVYEVLLDMGVHKAAAESLAKNYDPEGGLPAEIYARGAAEAFLYGGANFSVKEMLDKNSFSSDLREDQRQLAYDMGKTFRNNKIQKQEAEIRKKKKTVRKDGKQGTKGYVQFSEDIDLENMTERQKVSVEALEKLAEALGAKFQLYQSERTENGKPIGRNGWYDPKTGEIHIDIQAGEKGEGTILFTAAHELTHFIYQWSPAKFKILADFLVEQYGKKGQSVADLIRAQQAKAKSNGRKLGWMAAYQEMVADSMETMLADGKITEKLMELRARDKGLVQKIREWFKDFAKKLRAAYKNMGPETTEGRLVAEMVGVTERLKVLFTEGLAEAGENYRAIGAQKNTAEEGGEVLYSLREGLRADLEKVKNRTFEASKGEVEIGNTSDFLVNELDADPLAMFMPPTKAYRAMVTEEQAIKDGQPTGDDINYHGLGVEGLYTLLEKSEHPIAAFADTPTKENNRLNRIVLVTDYEVGKGLGVTIVEVDTMARSHGKQVQANKTITAYDKDNASRAVQEAFDNGRLLYIDKKNGQLFNSGRKGAYCPTTISEGVRKKNIQDFWANVKWKKSGKQEMSFDGGQKVESGFAEAFKNAGKLRSDRGNITTRSVLEGVDASQVKSEVERKHLLEYQTVAEK